MLFTDLLDDIFYMTHLRFSLSLFSFMSSWCNEWSLSALILKYAHDLQILMIWFMVGRSRRYRYTRSVSLTPQENAHGFNLHSFRFFRSAQGWQWGWPRRTQWVQEPVPDTEVAVACAECLTAAMIFKADRIFRAFYVTWFFELVLWNTDCDQNSFPIMGSRWFWSHPGHTIYQQAYQCQNYGCSVRTLSLVLL